MLNSLFKKLQILLIGVSLALPNTVHAQSLVKPGTCELIVKSKPTLSSAREYARNISDKRFVKIFQASNGWYAISIGSLKPHEVDLIMSKWKSSGKIPSDSLCSKGTKYVAEYDWKTGNQVTSSSRKSSGSKRASSDDDTNYTAIGLGLFVGALACAATGCLSDKEPKASKITFKNSCPRDDVKIYVKYLDTDDRWQTRGPWVLDYGEQSYLTSGNHTLWTKNSIMYYHAETLDREASWNGNTRVEYGDKTLYMKEYRTNSDKMSVNLICNN